MDINYMYWFIGSFFLNIIMVVLVYFTLPIIKKEFESVRNWFKRNSGYGYVYIMHQNNDVTKKFVSLKEEKFQYGDNYYDLDSSRFFKLDGIKSIIFNTGDAEAVDIYNLNRTEKLTHNSGYLNNLFTLMKTYCEAKAYSNMNSKLVRWIVILAALVAGCLIGIIFLIYGLQPLLGASNPVINV